MSTAPEHDGRPMSPDRDPASSDAADQALLDEIFDRALAAIEERGDVTADELLAGIDRPDLRDRVLSMIDLAEQVAIATPARRRPSGVGPFAILAELGHGGMGSVFLARRQQGDGRYVALKVLPPAMGYSARTRERFLAEANALARLRHPHIVQVHEVVRDGRTLAYAMDHIDGVTLMGLVQGIVRRGGGDPDAAPPRPTIDDVARVLDVPAADVQRDGPVRSSDATLAYVAFVTRRVIDVAGALELAHSQGLLHRDIKPANILLSRASHAYLTDFGLMRDEDLDMTTMVGSEGGFAGTAAYASPEQLSGETARIGTWSDVYSLGATLYHTLALRLPYAGPGPMQILLQVARGQRVALHQAAPWVPTELASVVDRAMELDPRQRIATASEFAAELRVALSAALATRSGAVG